MYVPLKERRNPNPNPISLPGPVNLRLLLDFPLVPSCGLVESTTETVPTGQINTALPTAISA